jgi:hypothetical protein
MDRRRVLGSGTSDAEVESQGELVKVIDVRRDERDATGTAVGVVGAPDVVGGWSTVLVLP